MKMEYPDAMCLGRSTGAASLNRNRVQVNKSGGPGVYRLITAHYQMVLCNLAVIFTSDLILARGFSLGAYYIPFTLDHTSIGCFRVDSAHHSKLILKGLFIPHMHIDSEPMNFTHYRLLYEAIDYADPAAYRIPLEIWEKILIDCICDPFLPSSNDSLLHETQLLKHDCDAHREAERTQVLLQLVCRVWNEILKRLPVSSLYWGGSVTYTIPYSTRRFDSKEYGDDCHFFQEPLEYNNNEEAPLIQDIHPSVEALVVLHRFGDPPDLEKFPNIRLLTTSFFDSHQISSKNPAIIQNITHLRIPVLYSPQPASKGPVFTNLRTLCIDLDHVVGHEDEDHEIDPNDLDFLRWSLPSLANVGFFSIFSKHWMILAIHELIERFGSTLKGLYMAVYDLLRPYAPYAALPENLWKRCLNLQTVCTSLTNFTVASQPPEGRSPLHIVLCDIGAPNEWQRGRRYFENGCNWDDYEISKCLLMALNWSIGDFQMDLSWNDLQTAIGNLLHDDGEMIYDLFIRLKASGRDFQDKNGNGMESEQGRKCIAWVKNVNDMWRQYKR
jgi:hypothetical protein